jgi:hypothetical protein
MPVNQNITSQTTGVPWNIYIYAAIILAVLQFRNISS